MESSGTLSGTTERARSLRDLKPLEGSLAQSESLTEGALSK